MEIPPELDQIRKRYHQMLGEIVGNQYGAIDGIFMELYGLLEQGNKLNDELHKRIASQDKEIAELKKTVPSK